MSTRTEVCVVGGGVIGLAVAFELARRGIGVTVLEAAQVGERAAAGVAAGMLAPAAEADLSDPRLTQLALASHAAYPDWVADVERVSGRDVALDRTGTLFVALHRDHLALLERLEGFQRERGLHAERVSAAEVRALEPLLAPNVVGGLRLHDDWQVDPRRLLDALAAGLRLLGGTLCEGQPVCRVVPRGGTFAVHYERGGVEDCLEAERVVIASGAFSAGAWSAHIEAPFTPLPLRPIKGQLLRLRGERLLHHVVRTTDVYLVPRGDGELIVGATMEEQGFDARVTAGAVHDLLREARRVVPGIYELELAECSVGFRPALRDHMPAVGLVADGLFVATGHFRNGVELAPITARLLADLVCDGRADPLLAPFSPLRFAPAEARSEVRR
jgi:glycine oxidase